MTEKTKDTHRGVYTFKVVVYLYLFDTQVDKREALLTALDLKHKGHSCFVSRMILVVHRPQRYAGDQDV